MSEMTFKVPFASRPRKPTRAPQSPTVATDADGSTTAPSEAVNATTRPPCRTARMLALAYLIDRQVESGAIKSYAEAARLLGVSKARLSQILNLLNLSPRTQEAILTGRLHVSERDLRGVVREAAWEGQEKLLLRSE